MNKSKLVILDTYFEPLRSPEPQRTHRSRVCERAGARKPRPRAGCGTRRERVAGAARGMPLPLANPPPRKMNP